ncbi:hypothetical protein HK105_201423 [Polyrhizophydium stewartii]|uniref:L domain-like protein n=1 Tax=Polyrhizophydium stewartii TaxID=2732419 RepID=A0ABR4NHZ7_9FUNG
MGDAPGTVTAAFKTVLGQTTGIKPRERDRGGAHKAATASSPRTLLAPRGGAAARAADGGAGSSSATKAQKAVHPHSALQQAAAAGKRTTGSAESAPASAGARGSTPRSRPARPTKDERREYQQMLNRFSANKTRSSHRRVPSKTESNFQTLYDDVQPPPLLTSQLPAGSVEQVLCDADLDPWRDADLSWSSEAPRLKELFLEHLRKQTLESLAPGDQEHEPQQPSHARRGNTHSSTVLAQKKDAADIGILSTMDFLHTHFRTLRLHGRKIARIDEGLLKFKNLTELSLTGNLIAQVEHIPASVQILHLNANMITVAPNVAHLDKLMHLGLSFNKLDTLLVSGGEMQPDAGAGVRGSMGDMLASRGNLNMSLGNRSLARSVATSGSRLLGPSLVPGSFTQWLPPTIVSLDLSWNSLTALDETVAYLQTLPSLKILVLQGNPLSLFSVYRQYLIGSLTKLAFLDETAVPDGERYTASGKIGLLGQRSSVQLRIAVTEITGIAEPVAPAAENPDQPPDELSALGANEEFHFYLEFALKTLANTPVTTQPIAWSPTSMELRFANLAELQVNVELRDALAGKRERLDRASYGMTVSLFRRRSTYVSRPATADGGSEAPSRAGSAAIKSRAAGGKPLGSANPGARKPADAKGGKPGGPPASGSGAAGAGGASGKGKRGKDDQAMQWVLSEAETTLQGVCKVSLRDFLMGSVRALVRAVLRASPC